MNGQSYRGHIQKPFWPDRDRSQQGFGSCQPFLAAAENENRSPWIPSGRSLVSRIRFILMSTVQVKVNSHSQNIPESLPFFDLGQTSSSAGRLHFDRRKSYEKNVDVTYARGNHRLS